MDKKLTNVIALVMSQLCTPTQTTDILQPTNNDTII